MAYVNVCVTYSIEVPEIDEIYNLDDHDLIDEKLNELEDEIFNDVHYFIERNGYEMVVDDIIL